MKGWAHRAGTRLHLPLTMDYSFPSHSLLITTIGLLSRLVRLNNQANKNWRRMTHL